ncbi:hypothetical protein PC116_g3881 [Phytophthora cactorum]|nr:hypothetical protein PC114_g3238 [Phytophthora cactorum]KAG3035500.1 hypothetical protein PC119_g4581 [Phytophthora cactorum]KAG3188504.1 hypothetical protein C6341_g2749 [Phytophthora cactorum]KAG3201806.1 hypothetical protein PC128_g3638 [Phytophthora cactorum]KAG4248339.1 hypothetical protein PC116_g3881 [Phytophthora cactorum]
MAAWGVGRGIKCIKCLEVGGCPQWSMRDIPSFAAGEIERLD